MRKKPYKASELFEEICKKIELPDILDYHMGTRSEEEIRDYQWDFGNDLEFGGNEGIYLDMYAQTREKRIHLGTFKTLLESKEAMKKMANLLVEFIFAGSQFVNSNLDDFTWNGYKISSEGAYVSFDRSTLDKAKERAAEMKKKYGNVTIFDYANRKEVEYES